jgi:hypothetical protein
MPNPRLKRGAWLAAVTILLHAPPAPAQSLGDAAARERARREKQKPASAKVLTNDDLPSSSSDSRAAATPSGTSKSEARPAADEATGELERDRQKRKDLELQWRERFAAAREAVARADERAWREVVRTEFYNGIPAQMKVKEHVETEELKQARQALADLEEAFRRTGLPPGWARQ